MHVSNLKKNLLKIRESLYQEKNSKLIQKIFLKNNSLDKKKIFTYRAAFVNFLQTLKSPNSVFLSL